MDIIWILLLILLAVFLLIGLYYLWQFWQGKFVIYNSNNLGNLLLYYFSGLAKAWQRGENFIWSWWNHTGKPMHPILAQLPTSVPLNSEMQKQLQGLSINTAYAVTEWENPQGWLRVMQPTVQEIMAACLQGMGHDTQHQETNPIVIHFRCSDGPFNRHPSYAWNTYAWYTQILERIKADSSYKLQRLLSMTKPIVKHITLLACHTHLSCPRNQHACSEYAQDFKTFLEEQGYTVDIKCGSLDLDYATMLRASTLIAAISSFSTLAAVARRGQSYLPMPPLNSEMSKLTSPNLQYIPGEHLHHARVKDYYDIKTVCQQLRTSSN